MTDQQTFRRVAIVNRGEPAMRFIAAAREVSNLDGEPVTTIALFTDPDRGAMFVREADEALGIGPASSYLDYDRLESALIECRAEAVWVGWGFVAEHPGFVDLCDRLGVVFIGPSANMMRRLGDKINSKRLAEDAKVPVAPWSDGPVASVESALQWGETLGYPVMIKATAGGGGRGIRKVRSSSEMADAFNSASSEATKAFGDPTVFIEKMMTGARHVEVQVIADNHGDVWTLGVRDCTVQRRNQKIIEETPCPVLSYDKHHELEDAAAKLVRTIGYRNAGTVEFLYDPRSESFSFMEVNARLQVEHPITEVITGADLVKLQIHVARGGALAHVAPMQRGHAIEVRLNAEDPDDSFAPAPGVIEYLRLPHGPGIRIDTGVAEGDSIAPQFDSMIGKIIAWGENRPAAIARLRRALVETSVVVRGGTTNKGFLLDLLARPEIATSEVDVGWMDRQVAAGTHISHRHAEVALLVAAVDAYDAELAVEQARFYAAAARGRPEAEAQVGRELELTYRGNPYQMRVSRLAPERYRVEVDGHCVEIEVAALRDRERWLSAGQHRYRVLSVDQGLSLLVEVDGVPHRISRDRGGMVRAPSPAVVVSIEVAEGDEVSPGDRLAVLEAMKMEMPVVAQFAGRVREVAVIAGVQVEAGAPLVIIEPTGERQEASAARLDLDAVAPSCRPEPGLRELRSLVLGYDATEIQCNPELLGDPDQLAEADEIVATFTDLCSLVHRRTTDEGDDFGGHTSEEYLFTYLRDPGGASSELPESFLRKLSRALSHYGVGDLEPSAELETALFRVFKARKRVREQADPILALLECRLARADELRDQAGDELRELVERLITETEGRYPAVNDLAREVRYRYFDEQLDNRQRADALERAGVALGRLREHPEPGDRAALISELVESPYPLQAFVSQRFATADPATRQAILEVLLLRYYRRALGFEHTEIAGFSICSSDYEFRGDPIRVIATHVELDGVAAAAAAVIEAARSAPSERQIALELYVWSDTPLGDAEAVAPSIRDLFADSTIDGRLRRVVAVLSSGERGGGIRDTQVFTFRPSDAGLYEQVIYRGIHPLLSNRLNLWRLKNFEIERLPSAEDLFLYHCVARDNPRDERLIALGEIRDVTPVRDRDDQILALPGVERMMSLAVGGVRRFQSSRPERRRLHWNRIHLIVRPPLELSPGELEGLIHKLAPVTEGLGIERVVVQARMPDRRPTVDTPLVEQLLEVSRPAGSHGLSIQLRDLPDHPMAPLGTYEQKVVRSRQRGLTYPFEIIKLLTAEADKLGADFPPGEFIEHDLDSDQLVPVDREPGNNAANVVVGVLKSFTEVVPEGVARVAIFGDPTRGMGSLAKPECARINAALDLAERLQVPVEWYAVSAGARISMETGVENMDWIAAVLRRIVEFTQAGGEINIVVCGVNVGAQPYWNAEATMLMHTRGILVMVPGSAMVLTGKRALDYSGGVSAEDNEGIGGYERIMGPNGQAQYAARDIADACRILLHHYAVSYVAPGEAVPRRAETADPLDRDVCESPHGTDGIFSFATVGEIFDEAHNPGRKKPFDIRRVMRATIDSDHPPLERWYGLRDGEAAVVWDAHLGGYPVCMIGLESHPVPRLGFVPADGPLTWTAGTLFPMASRKVARAINAASDNRPLVVLANLSGFDGSPESLRHLQLEYGAEIGRAVVNFRGPMVFCVISRYHGGAFVVFSNRLNENLEVIALDGSHASVIGGAPAAAVVFAREVKKRTASDSRVSEIAERLAAASSGMQRAELRAELSRTTDRVRAEKLREVAEEFDETHSVHRAKEVGAVHSIIEPRRMRPLLIDAVARGIARISARDGLVG